MDTPAASPVAPTARTPDPSGVHAVVDAASRVGARLVYADDTWMYGRVDGPMTEHTPWRPVSTKGVLRAWIAERILAAGAAGRLQVGVVRAGSSTGPASGRPSPATCSAPRCAGGRCSGSGTRTCP